MLDGPFVGSAAVDAGLITAAALQGDLYESVFRDVFIRAGTEQDLVVRSRAAHLLCPADGALGGFSAAALHEAGCHPPNAAAELIVPRGEIRKRRGLVVRQAVLPPEDVVDIKGMRVTTAFRTARDLGRRLPLVDAVAAIDALARVGKFDPAMLRNSCAPGTRGCRRLYEAIKLANPLSGSVMETRMRLLLHFAGLPEPVLQYPLRDSNGVRFALIDIAYPQARLALEYDGKEHFTDELRGRHDRRRDLRVDDLDWYTMRFTDEQVLQEPQLTVARVQRRLTERLARFAS
ncbi:DUF559 domain-containing protein [Pseudonocardia sp. GCM10023141]|uniref:DUF559 domain-containing protein n=1 Tax=Pseudonocardia sp. GCM10023141 TaxID=3252653 RepID=UPI003607C781